MLGGVHSMNRLSVLRDALDSLLRRVRFGRDESEGNGAMELEPLSVAESEADVKESGRKSTHEDNGASTDTVYVVRAEDVPAMATLSTAEDS